MRFLEGGHRRAIDSAINVGLPHTDSYAISFDSSNWSCYKMRRPSMSDNRFTAGVFGWVER